MNTKQIGKLGEDIAAEYLKKKRYKILERNFRIKWAAGPGGGEIDIVTKKKRKIVFVEVKTLQAPSPGQGGAGFAAPTGGTGGAGRDSGAGEAIERNPSFLPEDEVDWKKKRQLLKMAQIYLSQHKMPLETPHQIDILAVELIDGKPEIRHFENAIEDTY